MTNGSKQQSLFSNPLVLLLVGVGVALIAVVLAVMVLQPGGMLKTATYSSPTSSPTSSTTSAPAKEQCECYCLAYAPSEPQLCAVKFADGECSDRLWEYSGITDSKECVAKNDKPCRGYDDENDPTLGKLHGCIVVSSTAQTPSP